MNTGVMPPEAGTEAWGQVLPRCLQREDGPADTLILDFELSVCRGQAGEERPGRRAGVLWKPQREEEQDSSAQ